MSDQKSIDPQVSWMAFTVPDADPVRDFYSALLGAEVIDGTRGGFRILRDPGGAVTALHQAAPAPDEA